MAAQKTADSAHQTAFPPKPDRVILHVHRIEISDNRGFVVDMKWLEALPEMIRARNERRNQAVIIAILVLIIAMLLCIR